MTETVEHLTELHGRALERYQALQVEAERASDRGGRGPSPADLAEARLDVLTLRSRVLRAHDAISRPVVTGRVS